MTLGERINRLNPNLIISLGTEQYGTFWTGRAKFAFGALRAETWRDGSNVIITYTDEKGERVYG